MRDLAVDLRAVEARQRRRRRRRRRADTAPDPTGSSSLCPARRAARRPTRSPVLAAAPRRTHPRARRARRSRRPTRRRRRDDRGCRNSAERSESREPTVSCCGSSRRMLASNDNPRHEEARRRRPRRSRTRARTPRADERRSEPIRQASPPMRLIRRRADDSLARPRMHVLLLRPDPGNDRFGLGPFFRIEPLGLEYIAAALESARTSRDRRRSAIRPIDRPLLCARSGRPLVGIACMHALETDEVLALAAHMRRVSPTRSS